MRFFKYLIFIILSLLSFDAFAVCHSGNFVAFITSPGSVGSKHCIEYTENTYCEVVMQSGSILTAKGLLPYASLNGSSCQLQTQPYECEQDVCSVTEQETCPSTHQKGMYNGQLSCVRENNNTLECSSDYCPNPDNKFCPSGYVRGTFNGQSMCVKNNSENPASQPEETEDPENEDTSAIKTKLTDINNSVKELNQTVIDKMTELTDLLNNEDESNEDGQGENQNVDTSSLDASVPSVAYGNNDKSLSSNMFGSSSGQCPADNTLSMNFMGKSISYTFKYEPMCNALAFIGYFILIIAYVLAARIVVQA